MVLAMLASTPARAAWTLVNTDSPVTVIRGTNFFTLTAGQELHDDDLIQSSAHGIIQIQDDAGNLLALSANTRVMLQAGLRISLLNGWLKLAHVCGLPPCLPPTIDTARGTIEIGENAAAIVAAPAGTSTVGIFSESGTETLKEAARRGASPANTVIAAGHFALSPADGPAQLAARPSNAFLDDMPVAFHDALQPMPVARETAVIQPARAVNYADVSPWLISTLSVRKRLAPRFRPRLTDPAFHHAVDANLKALPEWRVLLYPPAPRVAARTPAYTARYQ